MGSGCNARLVGDVNQPFLNEDEMTEKESLLNTLLGLSMIVEARDPYTGGHLWRVSQFFKLLAQQAGLSRRDVTLCEIGGFLHDLGKVGVPDAILNKPDRLNDTEFSIIKTHPSVGGRLLASHPLANLAIDAVVGHHERPDGRGYPHGMRVTSSRKWRVLSALPMPSMP